MFSTDPVSSYPRTDLVASRGASASRFVLPLLIAGAAELALACTPTAGDVTSTSGNKPTSTDSPETGADPRKDAAAYEVHEWGFLFGTMGTPSVVSTSKPTLVKKSGLDPLGLGLGTGTRGLGMTGTGVGGGKPILWFHLAEGIDALDIDVTVRATKGTILEVWPGPWSELLQVDSAQPTQMRWPQVRITQGTCTASAYPIDAGIFDETPPPAQTCLNADSTCEAATLATAETTDADCLEIGGARFNNLFYRGELGSLSDLPIEVSLADGADAQDVGRSPLQVRKLDHGQVLGSIVRVTRQPGGAPLVSVLRAEQLGSSAVLPVADKTLDVEAFFAPLSDSGLSAEEKASFRRTWETAVVGPLTPLEAETWPERSWDAVYLWVDASLLDGLAPLSFTPAPRKVVRLALVRITTASELEYRASGDFRIAAVRDGGTAQGPLNAATIVGRVEGIRGKLELCNQVYATKLDERLLALTISDSGTVLSAALHHNNGEPTSKRNPATAIVDAHAHCIEQAVSAIPFPIPSMNQQSTATIRFDADAAPAPLD